MQGNYGNRTETNPGKNTNRPTEDRSWRNNSQSTYQVRNIELETDTPQENIEEGITSKLEMQNEQQPRL